MSNKTVQIIPAEPGWLACIPVHGVIGEDVPGKITEIEYQPVIAWCITVEGCMTDNHSLTVVTPIFINGAGEDVVGSILADNGFCGGVTYKTPQGLFYRWPAHTTEKDVIAEYQSFADARAKNGAYE